MSAIEDGWEAFYPLLTWAETVSQHHAMLRTEPPWTSTQALKEALASAHAALAARGEPGPITAAAHGRLTGHTHSGCIDCERLNREFQRYAAALATPTTPEPDQ